LSEQFGEVAAWWTTDGNSWRRATVEEAPGPQATFEAGHAPIGRMDSGFLGRDSLVATGFCCGRVDLHSWAAIDQRLVAWTSTDGSAWRLVQGDVPMNSTLDGSPADWLVEANGGRIVALNRSNLQVRQSFNGVSWQDVPTSGPAPTALSSETKLIHTPHGLLVIDPGSAWSESALVWFASGTPTS
jgi:hypothetical protein